MARNSSGFLALAIATTLLLGAIALGAMLPARDSKVDRELANIQRDLAAGHQVLLAGEGKEPAWYQWDFGAVPFSPSQLNDRAFTFATAKQSQLQLVPQGRLPPAYRIRATIRHVSSSRGSSQVGLYFARRRFEEGEYRSAVWNEISFIDHVPLGTDGKPMWDSGAHFRRCVSLTPPGLFEQTHSSNIGFAPYEPPADQSVRPWRTFVVDVTTEKLRVYMEVAGELVPFNVAEFSRFELDRIAEGERKRTGYIPSADLSWNTDGSLGLFLSNGEIGVREFRIASIPNN